jgi:hypothetical protein
MRQTLGSPLSSSRRVRRSLSSIDSTPVFYVLCRTRLAQPCRESSLGAFPHHRRRLRLESRCRTSCSRAPAGRRPLWCVPCTPPFPYEEKIPKMEHHSHVARSSGELRPRQPWRRRVGHTEPVPPVSRCGPSNHVPTSTIRLRILLRWD